ncbi:MAG: hypothetical protein V4478_01960 [Patescibacteria group bacterium]
MKFKKLLKEQLIEGLPTVRVVLNGGEKELHDATIPYAIGFNEAIAEAQPTHVLVIAMPYQNYQGKRDDIDLQYEYDVDIIKGGERWLFELSAVNYMQFNKPGKYNLIFILLNNVTNEVKKGILQKTSLRAWYEDSIFLYMIGERNGTGIENAYCEELVEIPREFFAIKPVSGIKKQWWKWVNRWFPSSDPIDECDFRKRVAIATTIQPAVWILGFLLRLLIMIVMSAIMLAISLGMFLSGLQTEGTLSTLANGYYKFVLAYPRLSFSGAFNEWFNALDNPVLKHYRIGKRKIKVFISPIGFLFQLFVWGMVVLNMIRLVSMTRAIDYISITLGITTLLTAFGIWHFIWVLNTSPIPSVKKWFTSSFYYVAHNDEDTLNAQKVWRLIATTVGYMLITVIGFQTPWAEILKRLTLPSAPTATLSISAWEYALYATIFVALGCAAFWIKNILNWLYSTKPGKWIAQKIDKPLLSFELKSKTKPAVLSADQVNINWLKQYMSISAIPKKITAETIVAPTKAKQLFLQFKVSFWSTKAKVCKPYAKS